MRDRLGRVVEDIGEHDRPACPAATCTLSIDAKVQFFAYQRAARRGAGARRQSGSVVVLDALSGEVLALANYPSYRPEQAAQPDAARSCATAR